MSDLKRRVAGLAARVDRRRPGPPEWFTPVMCAKLFWAFGGSSRGGAVEFVRGVMAESPGRERALAPILALLEGIVEGERLPWD